ncbi:hypothetical protein MTR67_044180 [Solanum verrucosum]|uniref:NB-ARC domain-containing protein n=1 Tax=Solanum verrucosum TaxID=315347 RepID=A0AAF0ZVE0_SOLVR|nr:hypothetical protein MTR67_044180 [Solanum verrucosum]
MMVGYENEFEMMHDQLARGARELEVDSIVGIGALARQPWLKNFYDDQFIMSRFEIHEKVTVSLKYCASNVLLGLLSYINGNTNEYYERQKDFQLADRLQKLLKGGRYLVVIDDIWSTKAWYEIKLYMFPIIIEAELS